VAFHHKTNRTLSVVLINGNSASRDVSIAGSSLPAQFRRHLSSAADNCADKGLVSSGAAVTLPANSVTTLYGEDYAPTVAVVCPDGAAGPHVARRAGQTRSTPEMFTLRGERMRPGAGRPAGVTLQRRAFSDGAAVASPLDGTR
jgi:hypothetical protein